MPHAFLRQLVMQGLRERYPARFAQMQAQIEEELEIIHAVGYEEYFLVVWDLLQECRQRGIDAVIVLGHRDYYPRFGFRPELARNLESPFEGPEFMALELTPGALAGVHALSN